MLNLINQISYYPLVWLPLISMVFLCFSKFGKYKIWNPNEMKPMKLFSWFATLFCTGTGVCLLGVAPDHIRTLHETGIGAFTSYMCWTVLYWDFFAIFAIFYAKYYKTLFCKVLTCVSLVCGLCVSVLFASARFLRFFGITGTGINLMLPMMILIAIFAFISVKKKLLVKYSHINVWMFIALIVMVSGGASIIGFLNPFEGITKIFSYTTKDGNLGWLTDQEFLSYIASTLSWTPFVARFLIHVSNGRSVRQFCIGTLTIPSIITIAWMAIASNVGFNVNPAMKLTFTGIMFILTMMMFLVTTLDSTGKLVVKDFMVGKSKEQKNKWQNILLPSYYLITIAVAVFLLYFEKAQQIICNVTYYMVIPMWIACIYCMLLPFSKKLQSNSGIISDEKWIEVQSKIKLD